MSAITMLAYLALIAVRDIRPSRGWLFLVLASLSTAALFFSLTSPALALPRPLALVMGFLNIPNLIFIWLFALSVFQTQFTLSKWHVIAGLIYSFPIFWFRAFQFDLTSQPPFILTIGVSIGSVLIMAHLVWVILHEAHSDLMEARKRSRLIFVVVLVSVTILTAIVDLYLIAVWPNWARLTKAAIIWPAVTAAFLWIIHGSKESFVFETAHDNFSLAQIKVSLKDKALFEALQKYMDEDNIYLNSGLTIAALAKELGVTSHRLRALINQTLGYENFNQFLNTRRIAAIIEKFDDQKYDHLPILTLALEGGFQSLAPFNKAFKERMRQTPSQYRKSKLPKT